MQSAVTNEVYEYFTAVVHQRLDLMDFSPAELHQFRHSRSWRSNAGDGAVETLVQLSSQLRVVFFVVVVFLIKSLYFLSVTSLFVHKYSSTT